jgi:hypothetical protein
MRDFVKRYPETKIFENASMVDKLYETDPDGCCEIYKAEHACGHYSKDELYSIVLLGGCWTNSMF